MEKIVTGIGFEITGALMMLFPFLIASLSLENTIEWNTQLGRFWQTVSDMGMFPIKPRRSPLRLRFFSYNLEEISCAI
ncbi:MAG: hypothetical protein HFH75_12720 [Lachnospiraceae bacterium]|nr:hypothetical protein [Lachnospiraceae bacterium]